MHIQLIFALTHTTFHSVSAVPYPLRFNVALAHMEDKLGMCQSDTCQMAQLKTIGLRLFQTYLNLIPGFRQMLS